jgi:hypothetical protein
MFGAGRSCRARHLADLGPRAHALPGGGPHTVPSGQGSKTARRVPRFTLATGGGRIGDIRRTAAGQPDSASRLLAQGNADWPAVFLRSGERCALWPIMVSIRVTSLAG